jgi:CheY-like chemotaxis protein
MPNMNAPRIFVVDDNKIIATTLEVILRHEGYSTTSYTNPLDALAAAVINPPDMLLSDVMMPELSGVELAMRFKIIAPDCKILLFSGQAQALDLLEPARINGFRFPLLQKPVHPATLIQEIKRRIAPLVAAFA